MKSYNDFLAELKEKGIKPQVDGGMFYEFDDFPLSEEFQKFYELGQAFLERTDLGFNFKFSGLYFNTSTSINALAYRNSHGHFIEIFKGTIFHLYDFFSLRSAIFDSKEYTCFKEVIEKRGVEIGYFLFQYVMLFFLYHEAGHLIQNAENEFRFLEFIMNDCSGDEVSKHHMCELDADAYGAHCLSMHLIEFWKINEVLNEDELILISSISLGAIYSFFIDLAKGYDELYYEENCHPHPIVRLAYTLRFMFDNLKINIDLSVNEYKILENAIRISEALLKTEDINIVEVYSLELYKNLSNVEEYINKIINDTRQNPYLSVNKLK